jgi:hypothetical protein
MSLVKALGDSAAPSKGVSMDENSGPNEVGMLGYVQIPFPSQMPAQSNSDVGITKNMSISAQQGTSIGAYKDQPEKISAETGK